MSQYVSSSARASIVFPSGRGRGRPARSWQRPSDDGDGASLRSWPYREEPVQDEEPDAEAAAPVAEIVETVDGAVTETTGQLAERGHCRGERPQRRHGDRQRPQLAHAIIRPSRLACRRPPRG